MTDNINDINLAEKNMNFISQLDLKLGPRECKMDKFVVQSIRMALDRYGTDEQNYLLLLHPTGPFLPAVLQASIPVILAKRDIVNFSADKTSHLKTGDRVKVDGCLGEYEGVKTEENQQYVSIQFKDMKYLFPPERSWRIDKYEGTATKINKYNGHAGQKSTAQKAVLCRILDLVESEVPPVLSSKMLIVSDKHAIIQAIESISLQGEKYSSVFATGYYKSLDGIERVGTDPLQRNPTVCITASMSMAAELIDIDPSIKYLVINGLYKLRGNLVFLDQIRRKIKNIIIIEDIQKMDEDLIEDLSKFKFKTYPWTTAQIREELATGTDPDCYCVVEPQRYENVVKHPAEKLFEQIRQGLERIRRSDFEDEQKAPFIASSFTALTNLRVLPIPLSDEALENCQIEYYRRLIQELTEMQYNLRLATCGDIEKDAMTVINGIKELISQHMTDHPKHSLFEVTTVFGQDDCVVVHKPRHKEAIIKWLQARKPDGHHPMILTLNEALVNRRVYNNMIFTGWFGEKHAKALLRVMAKEVHFILYPMELDWMRRNETWLANYLRQLIGDGAGDDVDSTAQATLDYDIEKYLAVMARSPSQYGGSICDNNEDGSNTYLDAYFVEFEDDYFGFLAEGYHCRCLDPEGENLVRKKPTELVAGDKAIFVKDSSEDIFDRLVTLMEESDPTIKQQVLLARLWRQALIGHKEKGSLKYKELQKQLNEVGVNRTTVTIGLWLNDETFIGTDDEAIRGIAKITGEIELNTHIDAVIASCSKVRALHVQLGRYLAGRITAAVTGVNHSTDSTLLGNLTDNLAQFAVAVEVRSVSDMKISIPTGKINRLLTK